MTDEQRGALDQLAVLAEPIRRRLYEYVAAQPDPVDRDEAAGALGIGRPLAAFHLDRLVDGGLLETKYRRRSGRTGPGAGRPAKFYRRAAERQLDVSLPPRRYGLAAEIFAESVERSGDPGAVASVLETAQGVGERLAGAPGAVVGREGLIALLRGNGYEPVEEADGIVRLRNCPFHALVQGHRELTCSMNLALLASAAASVQGGGLTAEARPSDGFCCVALVPSP